MRRGVQAIGTCSFSPATSGFSSMSVGSALSEAVLDPFISFDYFEMSRPTFPPHPHAGFSVATYILPDSEDGFVNRDSLGNTLPITPGSLHWTTAGRGLMHEERPLRVGTTVRGFQMFIDLPAADRWSAPSLLHVDAKDVPTVTRDGAIVSVLLGASNGARSPLTPPTDALLLDVTLSAGARVEHSVHAQEAVNLLVLSGAIVIDGLDSPVPVSSGRVVAFGNEGSDIGYRSDLGDARVIVFGGLPLKQDRVAQGPFVMSNAQQLRQAADDFRSGRMGRLLPID